MHPGAAPHSRGAATADDQLPSRPAPTEVDVEPDHCPERYPASPRLVAAWIAAALIFAALIAWSRL